MIGQLWFRLESNLLTHTRTVIQIEDFFGRIGGIFGILIYIFEVAFGDYINFEAKIRWIQKFYRFEKPDGQEWLTKDLVKDNKKLNIKNIGIFGLYARRYSMFSVFFKCCPSSLAEKQLMEIIDKGHDQLFFDFNYRNIVDRKNLSNHESEQLEKAGLVNTDTYVKDQHFMIEDYFEELTESQKDNKVAAADIETGRNSQVEMKSGAI